MTNRARDILNLLPVKCNGLSKYLLSCVVITLGILSITLIFWTNKINKEEFQLSLRADVLSDLRGEQVNLNQQIHKYLNSYDAKVIENTSFNISIISSYIKSLAQGGFAHHGIIIEPTDNEKLLSHLPAINKVIDDFNYVVNQLIATSDVEKKSSANQRLLNGVYFELMSKINTFTDTSEENIEPRIDRINYLYRWIIGLWAIFLILSGYVFIKLDLSRHVAYRALADSEEKYRKLFDNANDAVFLWEVVNDKKRGRLLEINKTACKVLGFSRDDLGSSIPDDFEFAESTPSFAEILQELKSKRHTIYEVTHKTNDGTKIPFEVNSILVRWRKKVAVLSIARDIRRRKQLNKEIIKNVNLELTGILAGGVAHDFNNLLAIIQGYASIIKRDLPKDSPFYEELTIIDDASSKGAAITQKLLSYAAGGETDFQKVNLAQLFEQIVPFVICHDNIKCSYDIEEELWLSRADPNEIRQVIENLLENSRDSMPDGGKINVAAQTVSLDEFLIPQLKAGRYVKLTFRDDGKGIARSDIGKIFAPYFSTHERSVKKGMGLGLAICHSIINRHKGYLSVESTEGKGTTVEVYLPV